MLRVLAATACLGSALMLSGCSGEGTGLYPVTGEVVFESKPLDKGNILFDNAEHNSGATIENGKFVIPKTRGLKPGTYKVRISSADPVLKDENQAPGESNKIAKDRIPKAWNEDTRQTIEVVENGPSHFKFEIK